MERDAINLCLGIHNHQPAGNFDHILENACEKCYLPFLQALERHEHIKCSIHFSGYLLAWIDRKYPEIVKVLARLVKSGQVEPVTGGFYEPILAIIPPTDALGQIDKLTRYLKQLLSADGTEPTVSGMWLAERVWEPHLASLVNQSGVRYTLTDDYHFKRVGLEEKDLCQHYITEEEGRTVDLFPINERLRYLIPFHAPEETIDYLRALATNCGDRGAFYFDDGEKLGLWPGTYRAVYTDGWLERFFCLLEENSSWIRLMTYGEYRRAFRPAARVYLPTASYREMMEWSLPPESAASLSQAQKELDERYLPFVSAGFWRSFLARYPEANNLHKKMLYVSRKLQEATRAGRIPASSLESIQDSLWTGQANDPYWHGVFGGLYLTNLRTSNYQALIEAETAIDSLVAASSDAHQPVLAEVTDFDCDGQDEILISTGIANYYLCPGYGGALFELDYKERPFNLIDTLARHPERYHGGDVENIVAGTSGPSNSCDSHLKTLQTTLPVYDRYRRLCFLDHFLEPNVSLTEISECRFTEKGIFVDRPYKLTELRVNDSSVTVSLKQEGPVIMTGGERLAAIEKTYMAYAADESLRVFYRIENRSASQLDTRFATELNFNFLAPDAEDRYYFDPSGITIDDTKLSSSGMLQGVSGIGIADEWLGIRVVLSWSSLAGLFRFPVYTTCRSESGLEQIYQGSTLLPSWQISLAPGQVWSQELNLAIYQD